MRNNRDPRDHYYLVRCTVCEVLSHMDRKPIAAERLAHKHAKRQASHEAYVIDVTALKVTCRYRFDPMIIPEDTIPF